MNTRSRIREILEGKVAMGAGIPYLPRGVDFKEYGSYGGVVLGGRKCVRRKPTAFNRKVAKIMKERGVPLGEAAKIASRERKGGVMLGGVMVGGARRKKKTGTSKIMKQLMSMY